MVITGIFTLTMTMSGTTVALPRIGADLDASGPGLQWVVSGYFLTFACSTLVIGSLADLFGRRRVFRLGALVFAASTLLSAATPSILLLDVARSTTGVGSAGLMVCGGAILATIFEGPARTRAYALLGTVGGIGLAFGPTLSGWIVGTLGWRASFLFFTAVALAVLAGSVVLPESRPPSRTPIDVPGVVTFILGLALVMGAVTFGPDAGWAHPAVLAAFAAGAAVLALFVRLERAAPHPVLDLTLAAAPRFSAWCLASLTIGLAALGVLVFLPTYLQGVNGLSAGRTGLVMLLMTVPVLLAPTAAGWLLNHGLPPRTLITCALLLAAAGNGSLTVLHPGIGVAELAGPLVAVGTGMGLAVGTIEGQAMNQVPPARVGMAAGFLNTVRGGGNALGLALIGSALTSLVTLQIGDPDLAARVTAGDLPAGDADALAADFTTAWRLLLAGVASVVAAGALGVATLLSAGRPWTDAATSRQEDTVSGQHALPQETTQ